MPVFYGIGFCCLNLGGIWNEIMVKNTIDWRRVMCLQGDIAANVKLVMHVVGHFAEKSLSPDVWECRVSAHDLAKMTSLGLYDASAALDQAGETGFLQVIRRDASEPFVTNICVLEYPDGFTVPDIDKIFNVNTG